MSPKKARDDSSDSSSSDDCNYYSGQAKRFKLTKQALFPSGMVKLMDNPKSSQSQQSESTGVNYDSDSSSEIIFEDIKKKQTRIESGQDLDESQVSVIKQVETLDDLEEYIDLSADISLAQVEDASSPEGRSSIPTIDVEDGSDRNDDSPTSPASSEIEEIVSEARCSKSTWNNSLFQDFIMINLGTA